MVAHAYRSSARKTETDLWTHWPVSPACSEFKADPAVTPERGSALLKPGGQLSRKSCFHTPLYSNIAWTSMSMGGHSKRNGFGSIPSSPSGVWSRQALSTRKAGLSTADSLLEPRGRAGHPGRERQIGFQSEAHPQYMH